MKTTDLTKAAILSAMVFIVTRFIQIPIPLGYFNVGNTVILTGCLLVPSPYGIIAGSLASALADLTSYPVYTLPTLLIKAIMPWLFYKIVSNKVTGPEGERHYDKIRVIIAAAVSTLIPLVGYTATGCFLYGGIAGGIAQLPGLVLEYIANLILVIILYGALEKSGINKLK